jgi:hypothetical protein
MTLLYHLLAIAIVAPSVVGSIFLLIRRSLLPKDAPELRRPPSQVDLLPARWRRWVLDEAQPRKSA